MNRIVYNCDIRNTKKRQSLYRLLLPATIVIYFAFDFWVTNATNSNSILNAKSQIFSQQTSEMNMKLISICKLKCVEIISFIITKKSHNKVFNLPKCESGLFVPLGENLSFGILLFWICIFSINSCLSAFHVNCLKYQSQITLVLI